MMRSLVGKLGRWCVCVGGGVHWGVHSCVHQMTELLLVSI